MPVPVYAIVASTPTIAPTITPAPSPSYIEVEADALNTALTVAFVSLRYAVLLDSETWLH